MSVYTAVHQQDLVAFLDGYALGTLQGFQGINGGIENSNFFLDTSSGEFVLTLFERICADDVKFCLALTEHLDQQGLRCPRPERRSDGSLLASLSDKPAAIVQKLPGSSIEKATQHHCSEVGDWLGHMHATAKNFTEKRGNTFNPSWLRDRTDALMSVFTAEQQSLLQQELAHQAALDYGSLPRGIIHGDLFRDNVLFVDATLGGVIDFYYACYDSLLLDLAIVINDWCFDSDQCLQPNQLRSLLEAYNRRRQLEQKEYDLLPELLRYAALRFWVSRSFDLHYPRSGEIILTKNPHSFEALLRQILLQQDAIEGQLHPTNHHTTL